MRLLADRIVPCSEPTTDDPLIVNGAIDIDGDGTITAIGVAAEMEAARGATIDIGGLLMPGLVNSHAHTPMTLLRSAGDGLPLERWLTEVVWPREGRLTDEDAFWGMTLGSAEMLLRGVTTSCEMYFFEDAMVDAVTASGARLVLTPGVVGVMLTNGDAGPRLDEIDAIHARHHDPTGRVTIGYAPHSPYDLSPEQCAAIAERARAVDAIVHIHLEETEAERQLVIDRHGMSATAMLSEFGVLEGHVLAAHGVWLDADDRRILAAADVAVAHCPQSNLKLGSGIADLTGMLADGLTVAVGTDGPASNDDLDLWEEIRLAALLARGTTRDPRALNPGQALDLATRSAAAAVGLGGVVGELVVGARADVIRLDLDHPGFVPGIESDLLTHLVFAAGASAVTDVWVQGQRVVADRACLSVDVERAVAEGRHRGARLAGL